MSEKHTLLTQEFFNRPVLKVAEDLIGKYIVRRINGKTERFIISETEAYDGEKDLACHASKGRTKRTEVMYGPAGVWYVYLVYGIHWMLNIVTGPMNHPAAVLIRGVHEISGPGRVGKRLFADRSFTGKIADKKTGLWFEDHPPKPQGKRSKLKILRTPRIGIDYSGHVWSQKLWRFVLIE